MKVSSKMVLGIFLVLLGLSMILNTLFKIDLPVFRIMVACVLLWLGVRMLVGWNRWEVKADDPNSAVFSSRTFVPEKGAAQYNIIFSKGRVDLTKVDISQADFDVEVTTVFGDSHVELRKDTPFEVESKAVFAESRMPDENVNVLGSIRYRSEDAKSAPRKVRIRANTVFGSFRVGRGD